MTQGFEPLGRQARGKLFRRFSVEAVLAEREFFSRYVVWDDAANARRLLELQQVRPEEKVAWSARASLAGRLHHPTLLSCREAFWAGPQHGVLVMEEPPAGAPPSGLEVDDVLRVGLSVGSALALLHAVGLHFGAPMVDPVYWESEGARTRIRVDLLARAVGGFRREPICANALRFVPPEIASGGSPTPAGDLFVLGTLMHRLLKGNPPPAGGFAGPAPAEPGIGQELVRLLQREPAARPGSAEEVCRSLLDHMRRRGRASDLPPCFGRIRVESEEANAPARADDYVVPTLSRAVVERLATFGEDRARFEERLTRAIALGPPHPPRSESERARRLAEAGEIGEALKLLPEARDAGSATLRAKLLWRAGRSEEALALLEGREESEARLLRAGIARERGLLDRAEGMVASGEKEEAGLWIELARLRWVRGHPEDGLRLLQETLGGGPSRLVEAEARGLMARILARLARLREASNEIQQAVSLLDPIEDEGQLRSLRVVRAEVDFRSGRWQSARQASSAEVDGSRRAGDRVVLQEALLLLAEIEIAMGLEGSAARTLDEAFALAVSRGDALSRLRALLLRLEALAAQGDWPAVRARARELSRFPALADCPWEGMRLRVFLTRAALETGFARPAREPLGEPAALFAELGDPVLAALYGCVQALALARAGQTEKASEVFERSVQPLEIMSLAHAQAHLYIDFATEPTFSRYEERVRLRRDAAERIARELGAAPLLRRLESESDRARPEAPRVPGLIASSPAMISALAHALRAARFNVPVHLSGESGTGKELVARAIHGHSPRAAASFVALNCAALPDALLEAELFGHTRGAFTGADRSRFGLLEQAQGGTLFLDEVADLSPRGQTLLLRVLQEKEYRRLGEAEPRRSDFRLISASHKPLEEEVAAGRFREDLYFRLKVVGVDLPPLRERAEDILPLAQNALSRKAAELGLTVAGLSRDAERVVLAHAWPGNVRELENEMVQALLRLGAAKTVGLEHLSARLGGAKPARLQRARRDLERRLLEEALARHRGNRTRAAQELGLTRQALYQKIRQYGLGPAPSQAEWPIRASSSAVGNDSTRYLSG